MVALEKDDDRISTIIAEIAKRHSVSVGKDDPILILDTLHRLLAEESAQAQQRCLKTFQAMLEESAKRWLADASQQAGAIKQAAIEDGEKLKADAQKQAKLLIEVCLQASEEQMRLAVAQGTERAKNDILAQIALIKSQLESPIKAAKGLAVMSLLSGVLVMLSAIMVLWLAI